MPLCSPLPLANEGLDLVHWGPCSWSESCYLDRRHPRCSHCRAQLSSRPEAVWRFSLLPVSTLVPTTWQEPSFWQHQPGLGPWVCQDGSSGPSHHRALVSGHQSSEMVTLFQEPSKLTFSPSFSSFTRVYLEQVYVCGTGASEHRLTTPSWQEPYPSFSLLMELLQMSAALSKMRKLHCISKSKHLNCGISDFQRCWWMKERFRLGEVWGCPTPGFPTDKTLVNTFFSGFSYFYCW